MRTLDPVIEGGNNRHIKDRFPFLLVDAIYTKVHENGRVRSQGVLISYVINEEGYRTILSLKIDSSESTEALKQLFQLAEGTRPEGR
ncbi:transposase [Sporolactobacillus sp. THM19-2]|uniref:transposase n=1 Tax=Sporolactobacillus sp. THM19-2 TaxID=2511171 RepID=UPI0013ED8ECC